MQKMNEKIKSDLEKLFGDLPIMPFLKKAYQNYQDHFNSLETKESKVESVKKMLEGKTIAKAEFSSYAANDDTLILTFTDSTHIKIVSDPKNVFDGLAFFVKKTKTTTVEQEYDEEIK
jgi:hypothetical protein